MFTTHKVRPAILELPTKKFPCGSSGHLDRDPGVLEGSENGRGVVLVAGFMQGVPGQYVQQVLSVFVPEAGVEAALGYQGDHLGAVPRAAPLEDELDRRLGLPVGAVELGALGQAEPEALGALGLPQADLQDGGPVDVLLDAQQQLDALELVAPYALAEQVVGLERPRVPLGPSDLGLPALTQEPPRELRDCFDLKHVEN